MSVYYEIVGVFNSNLLRSFTLLSSRWVLGEEPSLRAYKEKGLTLRRLMSYIYIWSTHS